MLMASAYPERCRKTTATDVGDCDCIVRQMFRTLFDVVTYDTNNQMLLLVLAHFIDSVFEEYWTNVLEACECLTGFNVTELTSIFDHKTSINTASCKIMRNTKLFSDQLHVKKCMGLNLQSCKSVGLSMYDCAVCARSQSEVDNIISEYGVDQRAYLAQFYKSELYRAYSD